MMKHSLKSRFRQPDVRAGRPPAIQRGAARGLFLTVAAVVVVLALLAAGGFYWFTTSAGANAAETKTNAEPEQSTSEIVDMDTFTVNLQGPNNRVLYIGIKLKAADKPTAKRIEAHKAELRSRLLTALSDQKAKTLQTSKGKSALADSLRTTVRKPFRDKAPPLKVDAVLFSHFVMH